MVRFRTLGALDLVGSDGIRHEPILRQPRLLAVLCYMALAPDGVRRRSTILAMFWPEANERRARHNLNQALYAMRQELGDVVISTGPDEVGIDRSRLECDAVELERAAREGRPARVVELYQGDFADGLSISGASEFQHWLDAQRTRLRTLARDTLLHAASDERRRGGTDRAVSFVRAALRWSPHEEPIAEALIDLLHSNRDRAGAVLVFREFARRLREDLDIEPTPELQARVGTILEEASAAGDPTPQVLPEGNRDVVGVGAEPPKAHRSGLSVPVATTAVLALALVATFWRATADRFRGPFPYEPLPAALAEFNVGIEALEGQGLREAREHLDRAFEIDTMFVGAALESAWAWCLSHLGPGCWSGSWPHVDSLILRVRGQSVRLTSAQRHHLTALAARRWNQLLGEYGGMREAARLDPHRYALEFADVAVRMGRWQEALDALARTDREMFGPANRWFLTQQSLYELGRHEEVVDSFRIWRSSYPEWQTQFMLMEARALGALGWIDTLFVRFDARRAIKGGEMAALGLLTSAGRAMLVHDQPGVEIVFDSAAAVFERASPTGFNRQAIEIYYSAGEYTKAHVVLDSLKVRQSIPEFDSAVYEALIAARTGNDSTAHTIADRICTPRRAPAPDEAEDNNLLLQCTRIAALSGRLDDARDFLREAYSRGVESYRVAQIRPDLEALGDDPLVRGAGR